MSRSVIEDVLLDLIAEELEHLPFLSNDQDATQLYMMDGIQYGEEPVPLDGPDYEEYPDLEPIAEDEEEAEKIELRLEDPNVVLDMKEMDMREREWPVSNDVITLEARLREKVDSYEYSNRLNERILPASMVMFFAVPLVFAPITGQGALDPTDFYANDSFTVPPVLADLFLLDSLRRNVREPGRLPYLLLPSQVALVESWSKWDEKTSTWLFLAEKVRSLLKDSWKLGSHEKPNSVAPIPTSLVTAIRFKSGWVCVIANRSGGRPFFTVFDGWRPEIKGHEKEFEHANLYKYACLVFSIMRVTFGGKWEFTPGGHFQPWNKLRLGYNTESQLPSYHPGLRRGVPSLFDPGALKSLSAFNYFDRRIAYYFGGSVSVVPTPYVNPGWRVVALLTDPFINVGLNSFQNQRKEARGSQRILSWQLDEGERAMQSDNSFYGFMHFFHVWSLGPRRAARFRSKVLDCDLGDEVFDPEPSSSSDESLVEELVMPVPELQQPFTMESLEELLQSIPEIPKYKDDAYTMNLREMMEQFLDKKTGTWNIDFIANGRQRLELEEALTVVVGFDGNRIGGNAPWPPPLPSSSQDEPQSEGEDQPDSAPDQGSPDRSEVASNQIEDE